MTHARLLEKLSLADQTAIVTGGGGGIGRGIALALADAGAVIAIGDIVPERAAEVAERIVADGGRAVPVAIDAMNRADIRRLVATAEEAFGRVDILVNNIGGTGSRRFLRQSEASWQRHIDLNLNSMLVATSAAVPIMIRGGRGGAIINVSSSEGSRAAPTYAVYAACKAGMESFTKSMAVELGEHGIRVNAIAPDHTATPGVMGNPAGPVDKRTWRTRSQDEIDAMQRLIPLGQIGVPEECGDVAMFLASRLARYVTGAIIPVDGGTMAASGWLRGRSGNWTLNEGMPGTAE